MKNIYVCFPKGKHKVLTLSYDDGRVEDRRLVEIMNQNGVRGTFHLNSGLADKERIQVEEWKTLYQRHEVSCHTALHPPQSVDVRLSRPLCRCWRIDVRLRERLDIREEECLIRVVPAMMKLSGCFRD